MWESEISRWAREEKTGAERTVGVSPGPDTASQRCLPGVAQRELGSPVESPDPAAQGPGPSPAHLVGAAGAIQLAKHLR